MFCGLAAPHFSRLSGAYSVRTDFHPYVLETCSSYRVARSAVNPLIAQDFHLFSTARGASIQRRISLVLQALRLGELIRSATENPLPLRIAENSAHAETEDSPLI
jgi:hypothetical protein